MAKLPAAAQPTLSAKKEPHRSMYAGVRICVFMTAAVHRSCIDDSLLISMPLRLTLLLRCQVEKLWQSLTVCPSLMDSVQSIVTWKDRHIKQAIVYVVLYSVWIITS